MDLDDFWRGEISPRRLLVLITQIPPDSALSNAVKAYRERAEQAAIEAQAERYATRQTARRQRLQQRGTT